jgi:hypothetical protein
LAVDATSVYLLHSADARVEKRSKDALHAGVTLATASEPNGGGFGSQLALGDTFVAWTTGHSLFSVHKDGTTMARASLAWGQSAIAVGGSFVYVVDSSRSGISLFRVAADLSSKAEVAALGPASRGLGALVAVDDASIFVALGTSNVSTRIVRVDPASANVSEVILLAGEFANQMVVKDGDLVLSVLSAQNTTQLVRVPKGGGAETRMRTTDIEWPFAIDGTDLYFFSRVAASGALAFADFVRAPYADDAAPVTPIVAASASPGGLAHVGSFAVDSSAIYFVEAVGSRDPSTGLVGATEARLMKVAK